jgi:hypothetical protein
MNSPTKDLTLALSRRQLRAGDGLAFLPAALELVETPPSPIGRAISRSNALSWPAMYRGNLDEVSDSQDGNPAPRQRHDCRWVAVAQGGRDGIECRSAAIKHLL